MSDVVSTLSKEGFTTLATKVYATLREQITSGALAPGSRLVRRVLSDRLGVSPMPVTESVSSP